MGHGLYGGSGRVPVCINTSDSNFNTVEKTGGASTHVHSQGVTGGHAITVNEMPSHNHGSKSLIGQMRFRRYGTNTDGYDIAIGDGGGIVTGKQTIVWSGSHAYINVNGSNKTNPNLDQFNIDATHTHNSNGGGAAHTHTNPNTNSASSLQPYITCYMWKRTG